MSQGFESKSADARQNSRQRKSKEIADIGSIQQSLVEHLGISKTREIEPKNINSRHSNCNSAIIAGAQG